MTLSAKNLDNRLVEFVGPTTMKSVHLYFIQNYITSVFYIQYLFNSNIVYMTCIFWSPMNSINFFYQFSIKKHQFFYCLFISLLHMGSSNQFNTTTLLCLFQARIYLSVGICHGSFLCSMIWSVMQLFILSIRFCIRGIVDHV